MRFYSVKITPVKITASWFIVVMATLKTEQRKGYGTLLMKEICRRVGYTTDKMNDTSTTYWLVT